MAVSDRFSKARPRSSYPHCGCLGSSLTHCSFSCQSWAGGWDLRMAAKNVGPHRSPTASQVTTPTADGQGLCLLQQHEVPLRESSDCGWGGFFGASVHLPGDQEFILEVSAGRGCLCVVLARAHSRPLGEVLGSGRGRGGSRQGKIKLSASLGFPNPRQVSVRSERPSGSRVHLSWRGSETKRLPEPERGPALCLLPAATLATVPPSSLAQGWGQSQGWSQGEVRAGIRVRAGLGSGSGQGSGTGLR